MLIDVDGTSGLDCGGESGEGWDNTPCTKHDISTDADGEWTSINTFCYGSASTCKSEPISHSKEMTLKAPGVVRYKYFNAQSAVPRVTF